MTRHTYARAGAPEYWIVRPRRRDVLVYSQPDGGLEDYARSVRVDPGTELVSPTLPIRAPVDDFFADAPNTDL